jgi:hypothetical protein
MDDDKKAFIKKLAHGVRDLMEYTQSVKDPQNDIEKFIKKQLFNQNRDGTYEFSVGKFRIALDMLNDDFLFTLLTYFDSLGINIDRSYTLASPNPLLLTKIERDYIKLINDGEIKTYYDFLRF